MCWSGSKKGVNGLLYSVTNLEYHTMTDKQTERRIDVHINVEGTIQPIIMGITLPTSVRKWRTLYTSFLPILKFVGYHN
jgi:hypothetical protein